MSFFSAVASGVSGLIRVGSQPTAPSASSEVQEARIEEVVSQAGSLNIEEPLPEPESMDIGETVQNGGSPASEDETLRSVPVPSVVNGLEESDGQPFPFYGRASSVPVGIEKKRTLRHGYVYDVRMMSHAPISSSGNDDHPEQPTRISGIHQRLTDAGYLARMKLIPVRPVRKAEAMLVHTETLWNDVQNLAAMDEEAIVMSESFYEHLSLYVCPKTPLAAQLSCGGVIEAALAVARGELDKSFANVRPPGHHAEPANSMGFCFFNNVAIATRVVQHLTHRKRIMILDWDVHHGNGTQRAFNDDPSVLYVSLHRYDGGLFYPCGPFGGMDSCGVGVGEGTSVNIPWPEEGMGDAEYLHAFTRIVMPIAMEFAPDLVIISAGFDAADGDELGQCHVTPAGYAYMTHMLSSLAGGKLVVALEGGYNVESISNSALAVVRIILGEDPPEMKPLIANEVATETVWQVAKQQSKYWKNIDVTSCEPREEYPEQTLSIPELLKLHRQEHLFREYHMVQVPLLDTEADERFQAQVICSADVMDNDTLVLLVHQFGNLRVELSGALTCDVQLEFSYLLDVTKQLVEWIRNQGYAYAEINTYPRPPGANHKRPWTELANEVVTYLWDNYILLSNAKKVILMGHGSGCQAVMDLISARTKTVMNNVRGVALVVGHDDIPAIPKHEIELRTWYTKHSLVAAPEDHFLKVQDRIRKRHGNVAFFNEKRAVKLLSSALPDLKRFIEVALS